MTADLRLIIFDVGGTLVDSQNHILAAMRGAFDREGLALPDRQKILANVGLSLPLAFADLLPGVDAAIIDRLTSAYKHSYAELRVTGDDVALSPLCPGAAETLQYLASEPETLLGIATGKSLRGLDFFLKAHAMDRLFQTKQVADFHPSKPHPAMVMAAMAAVGVDCNQSLMIGDTSFDMEMGRAAGVRCIGVTWGYHERDRLRAAGAHEIVDCFSGLNRLLKGFEAANE